MSETTDGTDLPESNVFAKPWSLDLGLPGFTAVDHADIEPAIRAGMAADFQAEAGAGVARTRRDSTVGVATAATRAGATA